MPLAMRLPSSPPPAPASRPRRRLRLVAPSREEQIAKRSVEDQLERLPVLVAAREHYPARPTTRDECDGVPRPCPFVSCKYNLALEVSRRTGQLRLNWGPQLRNGELREEAASCALDVAELGPHSQAEIARLLGGVTIEWVRQTERSAEAEMRVRGGPELYAVLSSWTPTPAPASSSGTLGDIAFDGAAPAERESDQEREAREVDAWAEQVTALVRAGIPVRAAWAVVNQRQEDEMAAKKSTKNKAASEGKGAKKNGRPAVTPGLGDVGAVEGEVMIGSPFTANHAVPIDPQRRDRVSTELVDVLREIDEVNEERAAAAGKFNEQLKTLRERMHELAESHRTSTEKRAVKCATYLLPGNDVIVRRLDTNAIVERRTATADELQPEAFPGERAREVKHKPLVDQVDDGEE